MTVIIADSDTHRLWVFALDMPADEVAALNHPEPPLADEMSDPVAALLGVDLVDRDFVEIFDLADLRGLGLTGYLATGNAIPLDQLAPDRARLDALQGHVLILFAQAFAQRPVTLHPDPRLTLIGSYAEDVPPLQFDPLPDAAAIGTLTPPAWPTATQHANGGDAEFLPAPQPAPQLAPPEDAGPRPPPARKYSNARQSGMVATYALLVMFAMAALMIWLA